MTAPSTIRKVMFVLSACGADVLRGKARSRSVEESDSLPCFLSCGCLFIRVSEKSNAANRLRLGRNNRGCENHYVDGIETSGGSLDLKFHSVAYGYKGGSPKIAAVKKKIGFGSLVRLNRTEPAYFIDCQDPAFQRPLPEFS